MFAPNRHDPEKNCKEIQVCKKARKSHLAYLNNTQVEVGLLVKSSKSSIIFPLKTVAYSNYFLSQKWLTVASL